MKYCKVQLALFREDPRFMAANVAARGAWLSLSLCCAERESGGRISECRSWPDRMWIQATGIDRSEVDFATAAGLAEWDDDDLVVAGYDLVGEEAYKRRRDAGGNGGRSSTRSSTRSSAPEQSAKHTVKHTLERVLEHTPQPITTTITTTTSTPLTPLEGGAPQSVKKPKRAQGELSPAESEAFAAWWGRVPLKRSRGQAERTYARLLRSGALPPGPALLSATEAWAKRVHGSEFVQHPSTWLNAKGWEDEDKPSPVAVAAAAPRGNGIDYTERINAAVLELGRLQPGDPARAKWEAALPGWCAAAGVPVPEITTPTPETFSGTRLGGAPATGLGQAHARRGAPHNGFQRERERA